MQKHRMPHPLLKPAVERFVIDMMKSADVRSAYLDFFHEKGHEVVPSSSLVPANDPTLLFTNAGMVQFKDVFLGLEQRPYTRAVSSQRCVRAGGKHNDLDNVGYTARHHTFFEMLGNFSFGDYFKRDAIDYAWVFLTQVLKLPPERLWITVFDEDDEAADIWLNTIKVDPQRFSRIGASDNFWSMGETGPCGPCSEIFYDHGPEVFGGPPGSPDAEGDRYVEIWNLVFMQYNRAADGALTPLPKPSVDTGMGLERLVAIMQGVKNNFKIDLFQCLIKKAAQLADIADENNNSLHVIADHIRSSAFLIVDGVLPSNEGRGYVLRRIIRRAIRHGYLLGIKNPFFYKLVDPLAKEMGDAYSELPRLKEQVAHVLRQEEARFVETLEQGMKILEHDLAQLKGTVIPGETVFRLYDTYGFPVDLTGDIARERGLTLDKNGFEKAMSQQRQRARAASHFETGYTEQLKVNGVSEFTGYNTLVQRSEVIGLFRDNQPVEKISHGEQAVVVLAQTPFYAESGGQVGDLGLLEGAGGEFHVTDTKKQGNDVILHIGQMRSGDLTLGAGVEARVNTARRGATVLNHSATHLLHAALRNLLGEHVEQKGSLVDSERLRFDFSHFEPLTAEQITILEDNVNEQIRLNSQVDTQVMSYDAAAETGAVALFGEKYGDKVRVLKMGEYSIELCGGTHVQRTGDIGLFKIFSESGIASGVRRIEAVTGHTALQLVAQNEDRLQQVARLLKVGQDNVAEKVAHLVQRVQKLEKETEKFKSKIASNQGEDLVTQAQEVNGIKVLAANLQGADAKGLRSTVDHLKNKLGSAAIVLAAVSDGKISLVAGVTQDNVGHIRAGDLVNQVAKQVGGKGGGRADMAQAGGNNPDALANALASVPDWIRNQLS